MKNFVSGIATFFGRAQYQKLTHHVLNENIDERLSVKITKEQQICDMAILKEIILSNHWKQCGKSIFNDNVIPDTIRELQSLAKNDSIDFQAIKSSVNHCGFHLLRSKLKILY